MTLNSETLPAGVNGGRLPAEAISHVETYQRASKANTTGAGLQGRCRGVRRLVCVRYIFWSLPASPEAVRGFLVAEADVTAA